MAQFRAQQVDFFSRYKVGTQVRTAQGEALDLVTWLPQQGTHPLEVPILLGEARLPCRLLALPVSEAVQRQARLRAIARTKQQPVSAAALPLAGWTLYVTNLDAARLAAVFTNRGALVSALTHLARTVFRPVGCAHHRHIP